MRFEAIEKDAAVFLRKFVKKQRGPVVVNTPSNTPTSKNEGTSDAIGGQSSQASDTTLGLPANLNEPTATLLLAKGDWEKFTEQVGRDLPSDYSEKSIQQLEETSGRQYWVLQRDTSRRKRSMQRQE